MYQRNYIPPHLRGAVREVTDRVHQQAEGAAFAIYVILDPTHIDPVGQFEALPIYVGMSSNVGRRVEKHYRRAALKKLDDHLVCGRMRQLMRQDVLARFAVIDRYDNELDAKIAETVYAQLMLQAGYRLYNLWPSQSRLLTVNQLDRAIAGIRRRAGTGSVSRKMSEQQANQAVTAKERSRRQTEARD